MTTEGKETEEKQIDWLSVIVAILVVLIAVYLWFFRKMEFRSVIAAILFISLVVFKFILTPEGQAKAIMRLGALKKFVVAWKGYKLDKKGDVVPGKELHLGGLRYVGIRFIDSVYKYNFRWTGLEQVKEKKGVEEIVPHEKIIDYISVRPDTYYVAIEGVETKPPERITVKAEFLITLRAKNPWKSLFKAPPNWNENTITRFKAILSMWITSTKFLDDLYQIRKDPKAIWDELKNDPFIEFLDEEWGQEVIENGIDLRGVTPPKEIQDAIVAEKKAELEGKGYRKKGEMEADGRAFTIARTFVSSLSNTLGMPIEEIQKELRNRPEAFSKKYDTIIEKTWEGVMNKLSMEEKAFVRIETPGATPGATGGIREILQIIAAWLRMPQGKEERGEEKETRTYEQSRKEYEKKFGKIV